VVWAAKGGESRCELRGLGRFGLPKLPTRCVRCGVGWGVRGVGCGVWGVGCGVWGVRFGVWGVGCGVWAAKGGTHSRGVGCRRWRVAPQVVGTGAESVLYALIFRIQSSEFLPLEPFPPEAGPSKTRSSQSVTFGMKQTGSLQKLTRTPGQVTCFFLSDTKVYAP